MTENNDKSHLVELAQGHFALAEPKIKSLVEEAGENERPFNSIYDSVNSRLIELSGMEGAEISMTDSRIVLALMRSEFDKLLDDMRKEYPVSGVALTPMQERSWEGLQEHLRAGEKSDDQTEMGSGA